MCLGYVIGDTFPFLEKTDVDKDDFLLGVRCR